MSKPRRLIRKCPYCHDKYFLKYYGRVNVPEKVILAIRERFSSEPRMCDFCVKDLYIEFSRPKDSESIRIVEQKRANALMESQKKQPS